MCFVDAAPRSPREIATCEGAVSVARMTQKATWAAEIRGRRSTRDAYRI